MRTPPFALALVALAWCALRAAPAAGAADACVPAPDSVDEAIRIVRQVGGTGSPAAIRERAECAFRMVHDRIVTLNTRAGTRVETGDPARDAELDRRRQLLTAQGELYGRPLAEASWRIRAGYCEEHTAAMEVILKGAGVSDFQTVRTEAPHAFPVIGMGAGADPDNPFTWSDDAFVPDSWEGAVRSPDEVWTDTLYFGRGKFHGGEGTVRPGKGLVSTDRRRFEILATRPRELVERDCPEFLRLRDRYRLIPQADRDEFGVPIPKGVCEDLTWGWVLGKWRDESGAEFLIGGNNGSLSATVVKRSSRMAEEKIPENATWFTDGSVKSDLPVIIESANYWAWPLGSKCPNLQPFKTGKIRLQLFPALRSGQSDVLRTEDRAPNHRFDSCVWEADGEWAPRQRVWTRTADSPR